MTKNARAYPNFHASLNFPQSKRLIKNIWYNWYFSVTNWIWNTFCFITLNVFLWRNTDAVIFLSYTVAQCPAYKTITWKHLNCDTIITAKTDQVMYVEKLVAEQTPPFFLFDFSQFVSEIRTNDCMERDAFTEPV